MHLLDIVAVFVLLVMLGVELSVSAFVNPIAWRLEAEPQAKMLSRFAVVLGRVMPGWYAACLALLAAETWLRRGTPQFELLLAAGAILLVTIVATLMFLVPLNNQVASRVAGWQGAHRTWDRRHRLRIVALAAASVLLLDALVR